MIIEYKLPVKSTTLTTEVRPAMARAEADLYITKSSDWLSTSYEILSNNLDYTPYIFNKKILKNKTVFQTNTTALLVTNITIDGISYFYKLKATGDYDLNFVKSATNCYDIVEFEGVLYSNSKIFYRYSDGAVVYTDYVIDPLTYVVNYTSKCINIEVPFNNCVAKLPENIFEPFIINEYTVCLPNFYVRDTATNKLLRFIREEQVHDYVYETVWQYSVDNQTSKRIVGGVYALYSSCLNRTITTYINGSSLNANTLIYKALTTSHDFVFDEELPLRFTGEGIVVDKNNYHIKIKFNVDISKIDITVNSYKPMNRVYNYKLNSIVNRLDRTGEGANTGLKTIRKLDVTRHPSRYNYVGNIYMSTNDVVLNRNNLTVNHSKTYPTHHVKDDIGLDTNGGVSLDTNKILTRINSEKYNIYAEDSGNVPV